MHKRFSQVVCCSALLFSHAVSAMEIEGTEIIPLRKPSSVSTRLHASEKQALSVGVMNIRLSPKEKQALKKQAESFSRVSPFVLKQKNMPVRAELNMTAFPVLNQGHHGSCVMFANTAAINYLLGKPDHVSQLCALMLGSTLAENAYQPSGWDGSEGAVVLEQLARFGYVSKTDQKEKGCANIMDYPIDGNGNEDKAQISLSEHRELSHPLTYVKRDPVTKKIKELAYFEWKSLLTETERFEPTPLHFYDPEKLIRDVKRVLSMQQNSEMKTAVTIGTLLYPYECAAGACGKKSTENDTWVLNKTMRNRLITGDTPHNGHELMITGYDDEAVAVDEDGVVHQGLFKLRNSWSEKAGDNGDYYMSYEYFKWFVLEVQQLIRIYEDE